MALSSGGGTKLNLFKYPGYGLTKGTEVIHVNQKQTAACIRHENGSISFLSLQEAVYTDGLLSDIASFHWDDQPDDGSSTSFVIVTKHHEIRCYDVAICESETGEHNHVLTQVSQCQHQVIESVLLEKGIEINERSSITVVQYKNVAVTLLIDMTHFLHMLLYKDKPPDVTTVCPLTDDIMHLQWETVVKMVVEGDWLIVLDCQGLFAFYSVIDGKQMAVVDSKKILPQHVPLHFAITKDFHTLIVVDDEDKLTVISLGAYFDKSPHHLASNIETHNIPPLTGQLHEVDEDQLDLPGTDHKMDTATYGDPLWKLSLGSLHSALQPMSNESITGAWGDKKNSGSILPFPSSSSSSSSSFLPFSPASQRMENSFKTRDFKDVITGLAVEGKRQSFREMHQSDAVCVIAVPVCCKGMAVKGVMVSVGNVTAWWMGDSHGFLVCFDLQEDGCHKQQRLEVGTTVLLSHNVSFPHLLLTDTTLSAVAFNCQQEEFVNKLMLYESATVADTLCRLNSWDRCSIPIHALEVGLKHRQLDTVAFFLKSRENLFTSLPAVKAGRGGQSKLSVPGNPAGLLSPVAGGMSQPFFAHYVPSDLVQVEGAIRLLIATVKETMKDTASVQFAEKLLHLTLEYLHGLVKNALVALNDLMLTQGDGSEVYLEKLELESSIEKLTEYIIESRQLMVDSPRLSQQQVGHRVGPNVHREDQQPVVMDEEMEGFTLRWRHMTPEEVILDGITQNCIPLVQAYLKPQNVDTSLQHILQVGLNDSIQQLWSRKFAVACHLLQNMGFDAISKLKQICFFTPHRELREHLISELQVAQQWNRDECKTINYLHQVEALYTCQSFDKACLLRQDGGASCMEDPLSLQSSYDLNPELLTYCGDLIPLEDKNSETAHYAHLLLDWVHSWDNSTRECVLLDILLYSNGTDPSNISVSANTLFDYLTSHNDYARLLHWVQCSFPPQDEKIKAPGEEVEATWPYKKPLTVDLVQNMTHCVPYLKEKLLDEMARRGAFIPSELQDFSQLLKRLGGIHQSISRSNPCFLKTPTNQDGNPLTFHKKMIDFLTEEYMPQILYFYLDYFSLGLNWESLEELGLARPKQTWVAMLVQFRLLAHNHTDPAQVFAASLSCARHILHLNTITVEDMLEGGHIVWAIGMLLTSPYSINQVLSGSVRDERLGHIDPQRLCELLHVHPKLQAALFPMGAEDNVPHQDITVYQLLQGTTRFDPSKLFLWQTTNKIMAADEEDTELPHFSLPSLTSKYAYKGQLGFTYYLKHGRPTFAFCAFIGGEIQEGASVITARRQTMAYQKAHILAIQQFNNSIVAAACVAFVEMIGKDSIAMRTHLQVAKILYNYKTNSVHNSADKRKAAGIQIEKEISTALLPCIYKRRISAAQLLVLLEEAVVWKIDNAKMKRTSLDASKEWLIAILFCHVHKLRLTTVYLQECARDDHWVRFLTFAQMYQYPKELLAEVVSSFRSSHLREHLQHVIETVQVDVVRTDDSGMGGSSKRPSQSTRSRDTRAMLYSSLGISKGKEGSSSDEEEKPLTSSPKTPVATVLEHPEDKAQEETKDDVSLNLDVLPEDVFGVLFACEAQPCQWKAMIAHSVALKNPILSLLTACIQGASTLDCLCAWLVTSLDRDVCEEALSAMEYSTNHLFKMEDLSLLLHFYLQKNWVSMAATGFYIFQPESPLVSFLYFYGNFMENKHFEKSIIYLTEFKDLMQKYRSQIPKTAYPPNLFGDISWVEEQAGIMVNFALCHMTSAYDLLQFLTILDQSAVTDAFSREVPNINKLCRLYNILYKAEIQVTFEPLIRNETNYCEDIVSQLQEKQLYNEARIFAEIAEVAKDDITIKQLQVEQIKLKQTSVWHSEQRRVSFWNHCQEFMKKYHIQEDKAAAFFKTQVEMAEGHGERAVLCQCTLWWLMQDHRLEHQLAIDRLQQIYWKCRVQLQLEDMEGKGGSDIVIPAFDAVFAPQKSQDAVLQQMKKELLGFGKMPRSEPNKMADLSAKEILALESLVGKLLDNGQITEASKLASQFGYFSQDLAIVVTCMRLAHGNITSGDMDGNMKELLNKETPQRKSILHRASSTGSSSFINVDAINLEMEGHLTTMEKLQQHCKHGQQCCQMVLTAYKIAQMLPRYNYERVMEEPHFTLLHTLLTCDNEERFMLAKKYIETSGLTDAELCGFLADQILHSLRILTGASPHDESAIPRSGSELIVKPSSSKTVFPQLIELCRDPSLLGGRLFDGAKALGNDTDLSSKELALEAELLVRAHHCFTKACNMEGIANIIRTARVLSERLAKAEEFTLMLRLLTGVGRFSEMTYVFDILWQHHQFELLFRKGMEKAVGNVVKEDKLRLAILDYLKRYHPTDNDTYTMVSLHFTMYREIAQMLEDSARKQLRPWKSKHIDNTPENENKLREIIQLYSDAAESYLKEDCLRHAQSCVKQAQLVALQMHLLSSGSKVINLLHEDVLKFINTHTKFYESYIVAEAYNCKNIWSSALFQHVIMNGDSKYLQDFKAHVGLNTALILDVAERYKREGGKNSTSVSNMKKLLENCKDIVTKFKLARDLAFDDMWKSLLDGDSGPYLQDVMGGR